MGSYNKKVLMDRMSGTKKAQVAGEITNPRQLGSTQNFTYTIPTLRASETPGLQTTGGTGGSGTNAFTTGGGPALPTLTGVRTNSNFTTTTPPTTTSPLVSAAAPASSVPVSYTHLTLPTNREV